MTQDLVNLLADLKEQEAIETTKAKLASGEDPMALLADARSGMEIVGQRFAAGEYFIPDLVYSGEILSQVTDMVKPHITQSSNTERLGKIVLGTVAGDIHDIGLNIVEFMLDVNGFEVFNIGVDQPSKVFVDKIKETGATIVGLSGFLTLAFDSMKETIISIEAAGLRDQVKIMIGGGLITDEIRKYTGADAYGRDAMAAVAIANDWIGRKAGPVSVYTSR